MLQTLRYTLFTALLALFLAGCRTTPAKPGTHSPTAGNLTLHGQTLGDLSKQSRDDAALLRKQVEEILANLPLSEAMRINPQVSHISAVSVREDGRADRISELQRRINESAAAAEADKQKDLKIIADQAKQIDRLKSGKLGGLIWLGLLGGFGILGGGIAMGGVLGKRIAVAGVISGVGLALTAWAIGDVLEKIGPIITWGFGAIVALGVLWAIWAIWHRIQCDREEQRAVEDQKSTAEKAIDEIVLGFETAKAKVLTPFQRLQLFGNGPGNGLLYQQQSEETEELVRAAREKLRAQDNLAPPVTPAAPTQPTVTFQEAGSVALPVELPR
jgi:hypothetical protein